MLSQSSDAECLGNKYLRLCRQKALVLSGLILARYLYCSFIWVHELRYCSAERSRFLLQGEDLVLRHGGER